MGPVYVDGFYSNAVVFVYFSKEIIQRGVDCSLYGNRC